MVTGDAREPDDGEPVDASWYPQTMGECPGLLDVSFRYSKHRRRWFLRWVTGDGARHGFATDLTQDLPKD